MVDKETLQFPSSHVRYQSLSLKDHAHSQRANGNVCVNIHRGGDVGPNPYF